MSAAQQTISSPHDTPPAETDPAVGVASRLENRRQALIKAEDDEAINSLSAPYHALINALRDQRANSFAGMRAKLQQCVHCAPVGDNQVDDLVVSLIADIDGMASTSGESELLVRLGEELQHAVEVNDFASGHNGVGTELARRIWTGG
jgi:hypothetical protein